jgi:hypothetical protein
LQRDALEHGRHPLRDHRVRSLEFDGERQLARLDHVLRKIRRDGDHCVRLTLVERAAGFVSGHRLDFELAEVTHHIHQPLAEIHLALGEVEARIFIDHADDQPGGISANQDAEKTEQDDRHHTHQC